ncbi:alpha/beta-hydrolase [Periconia macrospinosa]|uniref:Alpha/beta-hydrolase n=1 Tax=Periconia macrospinosa TaxID=97972 RepID=A0A2V1E623_9PLEO|nr:alpha/beta-hydrolase [Periconia macrospinosa]
MKQWNIDIPIQPLAAPDAGNEYYQNLEPRTQLLRKGSRPHNAKALSCDILVEHDYCFQVRDGAKLYADIYRPANSEEKVPAIICWGPFGKKFNGLQSLKLMTPWNLGVQTQEALSGLEKFEAPDPADFVPRGYAIINIDSRGAYDSEGVMAIMGTQEAEDGYDVVELSAKLEWCNGKVGLAGNSHLAIIQWFIAALNPPSLAAIAPWEGCGDLFREQFGRGGIYGGDLFDGLIVKYMLKGRHGMESFRQMYEKHPLANEWWNDKRPDMKKINVPTYITGTWSNTMHGMGAIRGWREGATDKKWLRFHGTQEWYDIWGNSNSVNELMNFFDRYLKDIDNAWESTPRVRLSLLRFGELDPIENISVADFPLPDTDYQQFFLAPEEKLDPQAMSDGTPQSISYDSTNPSSYASFKHKFSSRTAMAGIPKAVLHMSCLDTDDMDVYVILRKLSASGAPLLSLNIPWKGIPPNSVSEIPQDKRTELILYTGAIGVLRASHRKIDASKSMHENWPYHPHDELEKITPNKIVRLEIGIWATGILFEAGESLELRIGGSYPGIANFGTNDHSLNVGQHTVHFGSNHESHLILPIVNL